MKNRLFFALLSMLLTMASGSFAQELHCYKAIRKDDNANRKLSKVHKKYFRDRPYRADKKYVKADKKECKAEVKEYLHERYPHHVDYYW